MKAGSAGSNPDDAANLRQPTQPLRYFLHEVGEAVVNLNTTVVGLDAVENGHSKPEGLNISWNPIDKNAAARKARRFVLDAVLVRVSDALSQYVWAISKLPRFEGVRAVWVDEPRKNKDPSKANRLTDITERAIGDGGFLLVGGCLLIHWRNRVVHQNSKAKLTNQQLKTLQQSSEKIEKDFASLSVERLIRDFDEGRPTLKDISSLVAMTIRLCRKLDRGINDVSQADLQALLIHYGLNEQIEKLKRETSPQKRNASIVRFLETTAPGLVGPFRQFEMS